MPVRARRLIRRMRGGSQAQLLETDNGGFYVVKLRNNPQHRRILVNELVASGLLGFLQISQPETAIVEVLPEFVERNPEFSIQLASRTVSAAPGWHFGSRFPGDPERTAVYDSLPDALLAQVVNVREFLGVLAFDKWVANADARQAVFVRARIRQFSAGQGSHHLQKGFIALMIDHGFAFGGPHWELADSAVQGLYYRPAVYQEVTGWNDFQPWLDQVRYFPEDQIDRACRAVPPEWVEGEEDEFERLLERLMARRPRVPDLLRECRNGRTNPFPRWR